MPTNSQRPRMTPEREAEIERFMKLIRPQIHKQVDAIFAPIERNVSKVIESGWRP